MSQAKVDFHKEQKAKIKKTMKREKIFRVLRWTIGIVVVAGALIWFGTSVYKSTQPETTMNVETDFTAIDSYVNGLEYAE